MRLLVKFGTLLTFVTAVSAVCTRFPLKVERKADGSLESFCEYKAPNSPTAVKIIRGLKIQSQKCISCECTSMGLICCREDKPDPSTVPQGCMVVPDRCGYKMVLIHDRNVECLPLHMTGGTASPIKHVVKKMMSTGTYDSGKSSAPVQETKVVTESPKPHGSNHGAGVHGSGSSGAGSKNSGVNMAEIASTLSKYMEKMHKEKIAVLKPTTQPRPKTTTAKPDSMLDMMAMQSFIDGGGLAQLGGIEGLMRMNALGGGSLFGGPPSPTPSSGRKPNSNNRNNNNNNNMLDDYLTMKAMTESGALAGMGGLAGMASMAGMAGLGMMG